MGEIFLFPLRPKLQYFPFIGANPPNFSLSTLYTQDVVVIYPSSQQVLPPEIVRTKQSGLREVYVRAIFYLSIKA